eukprot:TRINITY_DN20261_c0_g4_i1.p1 TRINITY_DN20261_c0_g4~~TRINITY_DN20261_c0_g4_i1.p1  ORF type:complete len:341 (-),score=38.69 TRINITY_DN20261_c0_g4_i1:39-1061(-)
MTKTRKSKERGCSHPKTIKISTDCSGIDAPLFALRQTKFLATRPATKIIHKWSSDVDKTAKSFSDLNHSPEIWFDDMLRRSKQLPEVDCYVAGLPCQPFSGLGLGQGLKDARMATYREFMRVLRSGVAKSFVFENVRRLTSNNGGSAFKRILADMRAAGYTTAWRLYDSRKFGLAQSRSRLYIVGVHNRFGQTPVLPPEPDIPAPPISGILDTDMGSVSDEPCRSQGHARRVLRKTLRGLRNLGRDPYSECWIADIDSSIRFMNVLHERSPCLTRSKARGYWVTNLRRRLKPNEMLRLHGFDDSMVTPLEDDVAMGRLIGNTMSPPVVAHVLDSILPLLF